MDSHTTNITQKSICNTCIALFFSFLLSLGKEMKSQENITPIEQYVIDFVLKLRTEKSLSQDDIASILEVSRGFVSNVESPKSRAKYNLYHIDILADYFNLSPKDFIPQNPISEKYSNKKREKTLLSPKR